MWKGSCGINIEQVPSRNCCMDPHVYIYMYIILYTSIYIKNYYSTYIIYVHWALRVYECSLVHHQPPQPHSLFLSRDTIHIVQQPFHYSPSREYSTNVWENDNNWIPLQGLQYTGTSCLICIRILAAPSSQVLYFCKIWRPITWVWKVLWQN